MGPDSLEEYTWSRLYQVLVFYSYYKTLLNQTALFHFFAFMNFIVSFALAKIMAEYVLKIVPEGTHQYKKFLKPSELVKMLEIEKFQMNDIKGVTLNPIDYSFSLSPITKINYFMVATKK